MKSKMSVTVLCALAISLTSVCQAQVTLERRQAIEGQLQKIDNVYRTLPSAYRRMISVHPNATYINKLLEKIGTSLLPDLFDTVTVEPSLASVVRAPLDMEPVPVSNPSTDFLYSEFAGFTQSETSTAICGQSVVVGFLDSGSVFESLISGSGGLSLSGAAYSTNRGASFVDIGPIPPGANPESLLLSDPAVGCSDPSTFYFGQIFSTTDVNGNAIGAIALSKSIDGGRDWGEPRAITAKNGNTHMLDKPALAVDSSNVDRVYVSYTDYDTSFTNPECPNQNRMAIEIVASTDRGTTFSSPLVVDYVCGLSTTVENSQIVINSRGTVDIAWEQYDDFPTGLRQLRFATLVPGSHPSAPIGVGRIVGGGDSFSLKGGFRNVLGLALAVDTSKGPSNGTMYLAWDDGRNKSIPDADSQTGFYAFDDILLRRSIDGGKTWGSSYVRVNSDDQPKSGRRGHDHYQPSLAVDPSGEVAVCWYDRRSDPEDFAIERWCGLSVDKGKTWRNIRVNAQMFGPLHGVDLILNPAYMGDYDGLASDFTGGTQGFVGAFQIMDSGANPDVFAVSFP